MWYAKVEYNLFICPIKIEILSLEDKSNLFSKAQFS